MSSLSLVDSASFLRYSPSQHPAVWFWINLACLAASITLVVDILLFHDEPELRPIAAALYLFYNYATTVVWCVETGFVAWEEKLQQHNISWPVRIQFTVAVYFVYDSFCLLWQWQLSEDELQTNFLEAIINSLAYLYVAYECWDRNRERRGIVDMETELVQENPEDQVVNK